MTRPYAEVIGDPIAHSKSPLIHNFWLQKLGIDAEYRACRVRTDELGDYFTRRRGDAKWRGCNVTIPHKVAALALADDAEDDAKLAGAANTLVKTNLGLVAANTDCDGALEAAPMIFPLCLIGNGGAARAVLANGVHLLASSLRLIGRDVERVRACLGDDWENAQVFPFEQAEKAMRNCRTIINATSLGMIGQPPMPRAIIDALRTVRLATVFDMVYVPIETEFLKEARSAGHEVRDGLIMLVGQAARAFELLFGQQAPREHDGELRALLTG